MSSINWYESALTKIHLDMHCPEGDPETLSRVDPERIVAEAVRTGAQGLYFFAKDHYGNAYYDTSVGHKHTSLGSRDLVKEVTEAGRKAGLPIVLYYSYAWDMGAAKAHPDWLQRTVDGRSVPDMEDSSRLWRWLTLCHNTPYTDYSLRMLEELADGYGADGYHLDMFHLAFSERWCCYCATCQRLFRERTGRDLPREATWDDTWRAFLEFRYESVARCMQALVDAIQARHPGLFVTTNYHGSPDFDWSVGQRPVQHAAASTMHTGETYTPAFGELYPGLEGRFLRGLTPEKPRELVCWRMNRITDYTNKPMAQFRWEAMTTLANQASIMVIDQPFADGGLDPVAYDRMAALFDEVGRKKDLFEGRPLRHAAIYYSTKTRDWHGRMEPGRFLRPILGAYKALVESHIPTDFVFDEALDPEVLRSYAVVVLPDVAVLGEEECAALEAYVTEGGTLVATHGTSLCDAYGEPMEDFRLARVFGVDYVDTPPNRWHFWRNVPEPLGAGIDPRYYVLNDGPAHRVRPVGAEAFGAWHGAFMDVTPPEGFFSHSVHPPAGEEGAAVYVNHFGKGRVLYTPLGLARAYADDHELPEHRLLLRNLVRQAGRRDAVEVLEAPLNVEAVVLETGHGWHVHLLGYNATRQAVWMDTWRGTSRPSLRMDEPPMFRATIRVNEPFRTARVFGDSAIETERGEIRLLCNDVHEAVTVLR